MSRRIGILSCLVAALALAARPGRFPRADEGPQPPTTVPGGAMWWGRCPPWPQGPMLLLADGGVIAGGIVSLDERRVVVESACLGRLELPRAAVRGWRSGPGRGPGPVGQDAGRDAGPSGGKALILLANGDLVAARTIGWSEGSVMVEADRVAAKIPAAAVRAIDLAGGLPPPPGGDAPRMRLALEDGSRFFVTDLRRETPAGTASWRLPAGGAQVTVECRDERLVALAHDGGRQRFLEVLEPEGWEESPLLGPKWGLARGRDLAGRWPEVRGMTGFTGLGIHAPARVRYRLDPPAERFEALVAVDDSAGDGGSVVVRIECAGGDDGDGVREVYASPVLRGGDEPLAIRVDLPSAARLDLCVEPADGADILDRTLWIDPRVFTGGSP